MSYGRRHMTAADAALYRAVVVTRWDDGTERTTVTGPYNTPAPARAAVTRARRYEADVIAATARRGQSPRSWLVDARVEVSRSIWEPLP